MIAAACSLMLATFAQDLALPLAPPAEPVHATALEIELTVDGPTVHVRQLLTLSNRNLEPARFDLAFPVGRSATVSGMRAAVDGEELEGALHAGPEARATYRALAEEHRNLAFLEHYGEALYHARVDDVPAQGTSQLELTYDYLLAHEGDLARLHVPLTAFRGFAYGLALTVRGEIRTPERVTTLYSPTHALIDQRGWTTWEEDVEQQHESFRIEEASSGCNEDLLVFFKSGDPRGLVDLSVLSERPEPGGPGYFLAIVRGMQDPERAPEPRNVVFVVDRSGSMAGEKIEQARAALKQLVRELEPHDRFNVVSYSLEAEALADGLQVPGAAEVEAAIAYADGLVAEGDTNIDAALTLALSQFHDERVVNQIVFLTDGLPTQGVTDPTLLSQLVRERNTHGARIVAFGVGFDVNGALLDRIAGENHGMSEYVLPTEDIAAKVPGFLARMRSPVLTDVTLAFTGGAVSELFPAELNDLYGGHQVVLVGRYAESGPASVRVSGMRGGAAYELATDFELAPAGSGEPERALVARLWAAKRIGALVDELRLNGPNDAHVEEIVRLGLRFGILTEYTSFLTAEETDLGAFEANVMTCKLEFENRAANVAGAHGVAQACNSKDLQRSDQVLASNCWLDESGSLVSIGGVQCVNGCTLFKRGKTWREARALESADARRVALWTPEFYALLDEHPWIGACVARTRDVTLAVGGETVRLCELERG